jgi:hypothetical protein
MNDSPPRDRQIVEGRGWGYTVNRITFDESKFARVD